MNHEEPQSDLGRSTQQTKLTQALRIVRTSKADLAQKTEQLRRIADSVPIQLLQLDIHERILFVNQAASDLWQIPKEKLIGKKMEEVVGKDTHKMLQHFTLKAVHGETVSYESPFQAPDGTTKIFLNTYTPYRDEDGKISGFIATGTDITERKAIEATLGLQRHRLEAIFKESPAAMALWRGPEMIFEMVNPRYQALFPDRELIGKPFLEALPEFKNQKFDEVFREVLATGKPHFGRQVLARHRTRKDGPIEDHYYDFVYARILDADGNPYGVYDHAVDVTDQVLTHRALEQSTHELKMKIDELNQERELRDRFVAALTHDLRTPLTAAKLSAQLLSKKAGALPDLQKIAVRIETHVDRMDHMIRDLLDVNRIKAGEALPMDIAACDLNAIASNTISDLGTIHGDRFILLDDPDLKGYWNCGGVRRILENLCNNAVKYGSQYDPITVSIRREKETVRISVHNRGPAISPEAQSKLFQPFHRTDSAMQGGKKGWGLGLPLVKGIAEALGGQVSVESSEGHGTTFTVVLPMDARKP